MDLSSLLDKAIQLGFEPDRAEKFVERQMAAMHDREDRVFEREEKKRKEDDRIRLEELAEKEKQRQHEFAEKEKQREHELAMAKIKAGNPTPSVDNILQSLPKIPPFNDSVDEIDVYLQRFEKLALFHKWDKDKYAYLLGTLLRGKALKIYCGLAQDIANDYDKLKSALLKAFQVNPNDFRKKFRECEIEPGESYVQMICRMRQYFDKWLELSNIGSSYNDVCDFMIYDQLLSNCSSDLRAYLLEKKFDSSHEMAQCADRYMVAHGLSKCRNKPFKNKGSGKTVSKTKVSDSSKSEGNAHEGLKCHLCGEKGHIKPNCPDNPSNFAQGRSKSNVAKISVALASEEKPLNSIVDDDGLIFANKAEVVFDTGCNTVVVNENLIPKHLKLGKKVKVFNFIGIPIYLPTLKCNIKSKFFSGRVKVIVAPIKCADILIGLIPGLKEHVKRGINMINSVETETDGTDSRTVNVITRSQWKQKPVFPLVNAVPDLKIDPDDFANEQNSCISLAKIRQDVDSCEEITRKGRTVIFIKVDSLVYRKCLQSKDVREIGRMQLVVPMKYREAIMKLAHESLLSGHFSSRKTIDKIFHKFFWPKAGAEITRFCKSCHNCQKFGTKVQKVPLVKMPVISEPFSRIAIDIVGPITPASDRKHKYILTIIDLATRYPEAVPLKNIDTVTIAESLVEVFCRVGVPKEILSDRGTQFKSDLMCEIHRILSIRAIFTSPYHAACNGTVERMNGVLKSMLKKVCVDNPTDWDRYIPVVLFAYREIPNDSLKFSPFELLYGRNVRGPLSILHELMTNSSIDEEVKTTYQYVLDLRTKLQETAKIAVQNANISASRYKEYFDRKAKPRKFVKGEEVLIMLPSNSNKFLMQWKGPYTVDSTHENGVDYIVKVGNRLKLYHANMLKRYFRRNQVNMIQETTEEISVARKPFSQIQVNVVASLESMNSNSEEHDIVFCETGSSTYHVDPNLNDERKMELSELLSSFTDVICDKPGVTDTLEHHIELTSTVPVRARPYPVPVNLVDTFNKEIDKMLALDIIEPSTSPYCSPVVLIKKEDGSWRLCIDFRNLNDFTVFDAEPMPTISESLHEFNNAKFFTELDLCKGYWQIPMSEESKKCTAFATKYGLMEFKKMPFGLKTACATFVRLMRKVLSGLSNTACYFDNIVVHSNTWKEHLEHIKAALTRLREHGLTAGPSKCYFAFDTIKYLGYSLGNNTLSPLENRISDIVSIPLPSTKKQLRSFLGTVQFYNKFIPNFSSKTAVITDLLKKGSSNNLKWSQKQVSSFEELKDCLAKHPILMLPDFNKQFILRTDASNDGMGAVLLQEHDSILKPVCYGSKKFNDHERKYAVVEKECYAIVWAVRKFKEYLYGKEFILQTDHMPLAYLKNMKNQNDRLMRWALSLQPYSFWVEYIKGSDNIGSDMLSRC